MVVCALRSTQYIQIHTCVNDGDDAKTSRDRPYKLSRSNCEMLNSVTRGIESTSKHRGLMFQFSLVTPFYGVLERGFFSNPCTSLCIQGMSANFFFFLLHYEVSLLHDTPLKKEVPLAWNLASFSHATCFAKLEHSTCLQDFPRTNFIQVKTMPLFSTFEWADLKPRTGLTDLGS